MSNTYNNFTGPTRPPGDSTNAFATTAFVSGGGYNYQIRSSFPQDDQPVEWSDKVGAFTNVLTGIRLISAQTTSDVNIDISNPPATIGSYAMEVGNTLFLHAQTNQVQNFLWRYNGDGLALTRLTNWPAGKGVSAGKIVVDISRGDFEDTFWQLVSPTNGTIDTSALDFEPFAGAIFLRDPGTFLRGPVIPAAGAPQYWGRIMPTDLPPIYNGDSTSFTAAGTSLIATILRRGQNSGYWSQTTPWAGANELIQNGQFNHGTEIDMPAIFLDRSISGTQLNALEQISHSAGPDGLVSLYVLGDFPAIDLLNISSFKITGGLHIKYRNTPAPGTKAIALHGECRNIDLGDLYLENCADGVSCIASNTGTGCDNVRMRTLHLRNWTGFGISTQGGASGARCTNVLVERLLWHNDTPGGTLGTAIVARAYEWTGDTGKPGLTILSGAGDGALTDIQQTASTNTRQPQNNAFYNMWGKGCTGNGVDIQYGTGTLILSNISEEAAALNGFSITGANFLGQATLYNPRASLCGLAGINITATAAQKIAIYEPRIKSCSQTTPGAGGVAGIEIPTGINNYSIEGGVIGDQGGTATMPYGIRMTGAQAFFTIFRCDCRGNVTGTILNPNAAGTWQILYCPTFNAAPW